MGQKNLKARLLNLKTQMHRNEGGPSHASPSLVVMTSESSDWLSSKVKWLLGTICTTMRMPAGARDKVIICTYFLSS